MLDSIRKLLTLVLVFAATSAWSANTPIWSYYDSGDSGLYTFLPAGATSNDASAATVALMGYGYTQCQSFTNLAANPYTGQATPIVTRFANGTQYDYAVAFTHCLYGGGNRYYNSVGYLIPPYNSIREVICDDDAVVTVTTANSNARGCAYPTQPVQTASANAGFSDKATIGSTLACNCDTLPDFDGQPREPRRVGDPIDIATGNVIEEERDYLGAGGNRLEFRRTYNSLNGTGSGTLGVGWRHSFERSLTSTANYVQLGRPDGSAIVFTTAGNAYTAPVGSVEALVATRSAGTITGWTYTTASGDVEAYDSKGHCLTVNRRNGGGLTYTWSTSTLLPSSITDGLGHSIFFTYTGYPYLVSKVTFPDQTSVAYAYDSAQRLTGVSYSGGGTRQYNYAPAADATGVVSVSAGDLLTITNEDGRLVSSFTYDSSNRGTAAQAAGGARAVALSFGGGTTTVTNSLGLSETHVFQAPTGFPQASSVTVNCQNGCGSGIVLQATYDVNGNQTSSVDALGALTCTSYNTARNLPLTRIEGLSSGADSCASAFAGPPSYARVTTWQWHPTLPVPTAIAGPRLATYLQLDGVGRPTTVTAQPTTDATGSSGFSASNDGSAKVSYFTYDAQGFTTSARSPRSDVAATTTFAYDTSENLISVTDPTGLVTSLGGYDSNGRPGSVTEPNGLQTSVSYDTRGRVTQVNRGGAITGYSYSPAGLLQSAVLPSGVTLSFGYDAASRLVSTSDSLGNQRTLTLDTEGNVTQESVSGNGGALAFSRAMAFDHLSRLSTLTKAQ